MNKLINFFGYGNDSCVGCSFRIYIITITFDVISMICCSLLCFCYSNVLSCGNWVVVRFSCVAIVVYVIQNICCHYYVCCPWYGRCLIFRLFHFCYIFTFDLCLFSGTQFFVFDTFPICTLSITQRSPIIRNK